MEKCEFYFMQVVSFCGLWSHCFLLHPVTESG